MRYVYTLALALLTGAVVEQVSPCSPAWQGVLRMLGPCLVILFIMTVLDIGGGLCAAYIGSRIDPDVVLRGAAKKSFAFIVVLGVAAIELGMLSWAKYGYGKDLELPLNPTVAATAYYCLAELASILRNASRAGLPLPPFLARICARLQPPNESPRS